MNNEKRSNFTGKIGFVLAAAGAERASATGTGDRCDALWAGRQAGADAKRSGAKNGDLSVLHIPLGKTDHAAAAKRNAATDKLCLTFLKSI